jgi:Mg-chelatase subunit ChlD
MPPKNQRLVAGLVQLAFLGVIVGVIALVYFKAGKGGSRGISSRHSEADLPALLAAPAGQQRSDGIAVALLVDTSGSMEAAVPDKSGQQRPKIEIARSAVSNAIAQLEKVAQEQPGRPLRLGVYEFSGRSGNTVRQVVPFGPPSAASARPALDALKTNGGTPIGDAMAQAKLDLNQLAMTRQHILVVTDGENTEGFDPAVVMGHLARLPEDQRPGVYFVAFDVAASAFQKVKEAGALVLSASDEKELQATLDQVIAEKVLVE